MIIERHAKLLVVDSVASLVRHEFNSCTIASRQAELTKEAQTLKYLAETFRMPVVVTNQVAVVVMQWSAVLTNPVYVGLTLMTKTGFPDSSILPHLTPAPFSGDNQIPRKAPYTAPRTSSPGFSPKGLI